MDLILSCEEIWREGCFKGVKALLPEARVVAEPCVCVGERCRFKAADVGAAADGPADEAASLERFDMLGGAGEGHAERRGQFADRALAIREGTQHLAARGIGECMKDGVEPVCRSPPGRLFNHVVEYRTGSLELSTDWLNIFGQWPQTKAAGPSLPC
jgi:hypothetical protein